MKKILPVIMLSLLVLPFVASAALEPTVILCNIFVKVKMILAVVGFGIAVIFLILGGIQYMLSKGDSEKADGAKKMIINALIGVAIIFCAMILISLVEGFLGGVGISGLFRFTNECSGLQ